MCVYVPGVGGADRATPARQLSWAAALRPWAALAIDVETHGWPEPTTNDRNHRGQFGKLRWGNDCNIVPFARAVSIGWCAFAENGDPLERQELWISDAPPCQQRASHFHGLTDAMLVANGLPVADVLHQFSSALRRLHEDGGVLIAHKMELDAGVLKQELERVGATDDVALLTSRATDGVCTMQAAAAQQGARVRPPRTDEQLRNSFNFKLYAIKLASACRMYGVVMPAEGLGYRAHNALWDAEAAGRLYFAMRGVAYATAQMRPVLSTPRRLRRPVASADTR